MRILITNDDGINAPGLKALAGIAETLAGPDGEVWTVAPAFEQSGVAHCINYTKPTLITQLGTRRYMIEGSPADCVLCALYDPMKDARPDLILSGVNRGNNASENTLYSGTIGAAIEGALQGVPSVALSQYFGPNNNGLDDPFEAAAQHGADVCRRILSQKENDANGYGLFWNVNFPPIAATEVKGIRLAPQGRRPGVNFSTIPHVSPNGRRFLWIAGGDQHTPPAQGTDAAVNLDGYISVTPMRADLTAHDAFDGISDLNT
ncbi:5'-nucleotidase [Sulfitobacter undariae]|uniref:5'-nucleotidase SurE n=1 Tax=Sulfitobacter undariae TaxID=1563671 RepID=A0A7W6E2X1_9RHOB|nr:5'-nucleotidase [Sulfitobacter undariae]